MQSIRIFFIVLFVASVQLPAQQTFEGEIEGALYVIKVPADPSGQLLMVAQGYRPPELPRSADLGSSNDLFDDLLAEGWTIAATSYRRSGWIHEDAAQDIISLRDFVAGEIIKPEAVYIFGNSMGGGIATWIAENSPEGFDGALAMGAYLFGEIGDPVASKKLNPSLQGTPKFPILFQTNTSELEGPMAYMKLAEGASPMPVLRKVQRSGHVNQNKAEQATGLQTLIAWVESGETDPEADGTIIAQPESTAKYDGNRGYGTVRIHVPIYGNIITSFVDADLESLAIEVGDQFHLRLGERTVSVKMGTNYNEVPVGEWVAFLDAEGYLLICRNYRNAVESLESSVDVEVEIWK